MNKSFHVLTILLISFFSVAGSTPAAAQQLYFTQGNANPGGPCSSPPSPGAVRSVNTDGSGIQTIVTGLDRPSDLDLDLSGGKVLWNDFNLGITQRANLDGSSAETLFAPGASPQGIAVDPAAAKVYYGSLLGGFDLSRSNFNGSALQSLVAGVSVQSITLDRNNGHIYWTQPFEREIHRANLDGTSDTVVVGPLGTPARGIDLDRIRGKMYWSSFNPFAPGGPPCRDGLGSINRADLDGSNIETIVSGLGFPAGLAVDPVRQKVYWADIKRGTIEKSNLDGSGGAQVIVSGLPTPNDVALDAGPPVIVPATNRIGLLVMALVLALAAGLYLRRAV